MRRFALSIGLIVAACSGGTSQNASSPAEEAKLQPGQWEMTTQMTSMTAGQQKMPAEAMKPATVSSCLTADQVEKPQPTLFAASNGSCKYDSFYMANGILNFTMKCEQPGSTVASTVEGSFTATTMDAQVQMVSYAANTQMNMSAKLSGRRVGECTAVPAEPAKS